MASEPLQPAEPVLRIVLLGKTGVGKSASGNTILGNPDDGFKVDLSRSSVTAKSEKKTREFNGQTLAVVDTPGLFHTEKKNKEVMKDILDCIISITPGPHVFLLVLRLGVFVNQDKKTLEVFQKVFPDAKRHTIVLFIRVDKSEVEPFIQRNKDLKSFIEESCEGHHVFDNKVTDESQVTGILEKINDMVQKNETRHYDNKMLKNVELAFIDVMQLAEVNLASDRNEAAKEYVEGLISQLVEAVGGEPSILYEGVKLYLSLVIKVVYKCMPAEASESD